MATRAEDDLRARRRAAILDEALVRSGESLRAQAARHTHNHADAEDAFQQGCVAFLRYYHGGPGEHAVRYLMLAIKHSAWKARRDVRSRHRDPISLSATDAPEEDQIAVGCDRRGPAERAEADADVEAFSAALLRLKPDERAALSMLAFGHSYKEIMAAKGWTWTKANRCLAEGRARLRELVCEDG